MNHRKAAFLEKAHRALDTATAVLERGDVEAAINRAYYAAFYAALAALLAAGESPKTHKGTLRRFEWHYIRTRPPSLSHKFFASRSMLANAPITKPSPYSTRPPPPI